MDNASASSVVCVSMRVKDAKGHCTGKRWEVIRVIQQFSCHILYSFAYALPFCQNHLICIRTSIAAGKISRALPMNLPPFKDGASPSAANKSTSHATSPTNNTEELKPHCEPQRKCSKGLSNFSTLPPITRRSPSRSADNSPTVENILPGCALERTTAKPMPHLPESPRDRQMGTTNP